MHKRLANIHHFHREIIENNQNEDVETNYLQFRHNTDDSNEEEGSSEDEHLL